MSFSERKLSSSDIRILAARALASALLLPPVILDKVEADVVLLMVREEAESGGVGTDPEVSAELAFRSMGGRLEGTWSIGRPISEVAEIVLFRLNELETCCKPFNTEEVRFEVRVKSLFDGLDSDDCAIAGEEEEFVSKEELG